MGLTDIATPSSNTHACGLHMCSMPTQTYDRYIIIILLHIHICIYNVETVLLLTTADRYFVAMHVTTLVTTLSLIPSPSHAPGVCM